MSPIAAILASLGGTQGLVVLAQTLASLGFRFWQAADQVGGREPIPSWENIIERAEDELTNVDQDMIEIKEWLDNNPA